MSRWAIALTLAASAAVLLGLALVYDPRLVVRLDPAPPLLDSTVSGIGRARWTLLAAGLLLGLIAGVVAVVTRTGRRPRSPTAARITVATVVLLLPLFAVEVLGRPFVVPRTSIFVRDQELGWRLRPGADDTWLGVRVRVNAKGLRGPEVPYTKVRGATRILYLGDSVTFGASIEAYEETFPFEAGRLLAQRLGRQIETVNAAVGGWSPWQHERYLRSEGVRYGPDVVVLSFVLNDVLEEAVLSAPGRLDRRFQVRRSASSAWDRLVAQSGLATLVTAVGRRLFRGGELDARAPGTEALDLRSIVLEPDRPDVARAWKVTLQSLDRIVGFCRERELPLVLVSFPLRSQLDDPAGASAPQAMLRAFAVERDVPFVDLLPPLSRHTDRRLEAFLDETHLSPSGHARVAAVLSDSLSQSLSSSER